MFLTEFFKDKFKQGVFINIGFYEGVFWVQT